MGEERAGQPGPTNQRVTVPEAAELLGITVEAVRMRIKRGTLRSERQGGRVFVLLGQSQPTDRPDEPTTLISEMRSRIQFLEDELQRKDAILLNLTEAMKALSPPAQEEPSEARESPQTVEEETERAPPPSRSSTGDPEVATEGLSEAEPSLLWERVVAVILSVLAMFTWVLWERALPVDVHTANVLTGGSLILGLLGVPGFFGFRLGLNLRSLRFWPDVAPGSALLWLGCTIALLVLTTAWVRGPGRLVGIPLTSAAALASISGIVYMFAAVMGNAIQRRNRAQLMEESSSEFPPESVLAAQGWTPRQQAIVGLVGTIVASLIGLIGTILTLMITGSGG